MSGGSCAGGAPCTCGCCEPVAAETPRLLWNRPGLERIDYRVGSYSSFRRTMLEAISRHPELRRFTARNDEDYGIAVISMWAYVADILTFYGERAMHEAFLGTAIHDRSLRRLAATLDYLPAPGVAATAHLAYLAEDDKHFEVRPRMRIQSVPGQDEKPQKFEPIETVPVEPALNSVPVLPAPTSGALAAGATSAALTPAFAVAGPALAAGDKLVAHAGGQVEEKLLDAVEQPDWRTMLRWKPALVAGGATFYKWRRKMRLFGHNAPNPWLEPQFNGSGTLTGFKKVEPGDSGYNVTIQSSDDRLHLDGTYDIGRGTRVLVTGLVKTVETPFAVVKQVEGVDSVAQSVGPLTGSPTRLNLQGALGVDTELHTVTVYELVEVIPGQSTIALWPSTYGDSIPAGASEVYVRADAADLEEVLPRVTKGRRLVLADDLGVTHSATAVGPPAVQSFGGVDHLKVSFSPPLAAGLETRTAVLRGNVARATHGESVAGEVLGSGDAAETFQRFELAKPRVTHVPDPSAEYGAASTLEVRVDGGRWQRARNFYGHGPDERIYVARWDEKGKMSVRFGDGRTGARVTSGKNNVTASYRHGLGLDGRVAAEALRVALDRPPGLKSVANPAAAYGGSDPETGERVRRNAANGVRTFGRIVSLTDFEDAAREYSGVAKAYAVEREAGGEPGVWLFVAGDNGAQLGTAGLAALRAYLDLRRDPHRRLTVRDHRPVPMLLELNVAVDPDFLGETVQGAVADALAGHFDFDRRDLGEAVALSDLYRVAQEVDGVLGVDFDRLTFKYPGTLDLTGRSLRFEGAVLADLQPRLLLYGDERAAIETAATDVVVNLGIPGAEGAV